MARLPFEYLIGKYEVTNAEYATFLNQKAKTDPSNLYNPLMAGYGIVRWGSDGNYQYGVQSGFENKPVVYVSWFDGARFTNWLGNGQGNGDTESGAYTLDGKKSGIVLVNAGAGVYLPSEDQWYKASYYDAVNNTYSLYSTQSNSITTDDANFNSSGSVEIGSYSLTSYYGTYDQAGNICEWNDAVVDSNRRGLRGGAFTSSEVPLQSTSSYSDLPQTEFHDTGFRVAAKVPEPSSFLITLLSLGGFLIRRRR